MLAEIAVATFTQKYRELYTYQVPIEMESSLQIGMGVLVRFGPRVLDGIVFKLNHETSTRKLNPILRLVKPQPVLSSWQIALVDFISSYYAASLHAAIQTVSPFAFKDLPTPKPERVISFKAAATPDNKLGPKAKQLLELLARLQSIPYHELTQTHAFGAATIKSLVTAGLAAASEQLSTRAKLTLPAAEPPFVLTAGQQQIFDQIKVDMQRQPSKFLLMGVTNSGKTEIYLQTIATLIQQGGSAIMLVPEIALTPQTVGRFERRFPGQVALWHSLLTPTQRARTYRQIQNGEIKVVIGSRSALFSPLPDLKLIVIDEEHEISYKQEQNPRYHARLVAEKISSLRGASLILGSATPAVESYAKAQNGEYTLLELPLTINQQTIASTVSTVDLRDELMANNRTTLSKALQTAIADNLSKGEQTILFLNRRGKSTCVLCRECGFVYKCPHCDLPLTLHADGNHAELICHHCGFKQQPDSACPR